MLHTAAVWPAAWAGDFTGILRPFLRTIRRLALKADLADGDSRGSQDARGSHNDARGDPEEAAHVDGADSEGPVIEVDRRP